MYKPCLYANHRIITPLISLLPPQLAYRLVKATGKIGKPLDSHTSYLFDFPAAPVGVDAVMKYLKVGRQEAEEIISRFFLLETRFELENIWLSRHRDSNIEQIIDMAAIGKVSGMISANGPMLLLSAHTTYYFMLLWALTILGHKTAFMMVNPRSAVRNNAIMQRSLIRSADALSAVMPVIFTDESGTVRKSIELINKGYTLLMLLDIPGYQDRGTKVSLFGSDVWIPAGCLRIRQQTEVPSAFVFSHAGDIDKPYRVTCSGPIAGNQPLNLQEWAAALEEVVQSSPGSWFGWFVLKDMI